MINLLPDNEKKLIEREYHLRLVAVGLFLLFVVAIIGTVLLLPSYVLSTYKAKTAEMVPLKEEDRLEREKMAEEVKSTRALMAALAGEKEEGTLPSELIAIVAKHKGANTIMSINFAQKDAGGFQATVLGIARNRQSLLAFQNGLKTEDVIKKADLPVSDLAKNADINFTLTIEGDF